MSAAQQPRRSSSRGSVLFDARVIARRDARLAAQILAQHGFSLAFSLHFVMRFSNGVPQQRT